MRLKNLPVLSLLVLAAAAPQARAGFEFVAPGATGKNAGQAAANIKTDMPAVPADTIDSEPLPVASTADRKAAPMDPLLGPAPAGLTPVSRDPSALRIDDAPSAVAINPQALPPALDIPGAEPMPSNAPVAPLPPADDNAVVQGFGNQVTLALALQQIVPSSYRYSFEPGINPGMKITWAGGKPWKEIVADIARANRFDVDIVSNVVAFRKRMTPSAVKTVAMPPVAEMPATTQPADALPPATPLPEAAPPVTPQPADAAPVPAAAKPMPLVTEAKDGKVIELYNEPEAVPQAAPAPADAPPAPAPGLDAAFDAPTANPGSDIDSTGMPAPIEPVAKPANDTLFDSSAPPAGERRMLGSMKDQPEIAPSADSFDQPPMKPMATTPAVPAPSSDQIFEQVSPEDKTSLNASRTKLAANADQQKKKLQLIHVQDTPPVETTSSFSDETQKDDLGPGPEPLDLIKENTSPLAGQNLKNNIISSSQLPAAAEEAAAPKATLHDMEAVQDWTGTKNETVRQTLTKWTEQAGVSLVWSSEYDYPLQTDLHMSATFPEAVRTLLAGFSKAQPRPLGRFFKNSQGGASPVLIIETQRVTD